MNFDIKTEQISDDAYVISLAGEVDLYTAPEFKQQLLEVIGQGGKPVIVDFTSTTFIDSTTLGVLVGGVKRLRTNDGQLSLVCSDRNITKIFEITGLDRVFAIHATRDEAISKLGGVSQPSCVGPPLRHVLAITASLLLRGARRGRLRRSRAGRSRRRRARGSSCSSRTAKARRSCHTLADAKSTGTLGPNLDDAFSSDKAQGFSEQTMADIVRGQIAYPEEPMPAEPLPGSGRARHRALRREVLRQPELRRDRETTAPPDDDQGRRPPRLRRSPTARQCSPRPAAAGVTR